MLFCEIRGARTAQLDGDDALRRTMIPVISWGCRSNTDFRISSKERRSSSGYTAQRRCSSTKTTRRGELPFNSIAGAMGLWFEEDFVGFCPSIDESDALPQNQESCGYRSNAKFRIPSIDREGCFFLELHGAKTIRRTIIQSDSWGCESSEQIGSRLSIAESDALPRTPRREDSEAQRRRHAMTNNQPCQ